MHDPLSGLSSLHGDHFGISTGWPCETPRLFTATLELFLGEETLSVFHACHAASAREALKGLAQRIPTALLPMADVRAGIDAAHPVVSRLVPSQTLESLATIGDCCPNTRPLAFGGVVHIQERMG